MRKGSKFVAPVRIGTAGWGVPAQYTEDFPVEGSHLQRYAQRVNAVEINSSFHRPHRRAVYERWAASTPADFRFSVKLPKAMTHDHRLAGCAALIQEFAEQAAGLGDKLAVLLIQLPPSAVVKRRTADAFFNRLRKAIDVPLALEPRHSTWFAPKVDSWLAERHVARVAADPVPRLVPQEAGAGAPGGWTGLSYYRWHGSPRVYFSDYPAAKLAALSRRVTEDRLSGRAVWCIFDNTGGGHALGNALSLAGRTNEPSRGKAARSFFDAPHPGANPVRMESSEAACRFTATT